MNGWIEGGGYLSLYALGQRIFHLVTLSHKVHICYLKKRRLIMITQYQGKRCEYLRN